VRDKGEICYGRSNNFGNELSLNFGYLYRRRKRYGQSFGGKN
jgi:hypothetical protein